MARFHVVAISLFVLLLGSTAVYAVPVANDDDFTGFMNGVITGDVKANDTPPNSTAFFLGTPPPGVNLLTDGTLTYTPPIGFQGDEFFDYSLQENNIVCNLVPYDPTGPFHSLCWDDAQVRLHVNPFPNTAPFQVGSIPDQTVNEDSPPVVVDLSAFFDDAEIATFNDVLTYFVTSGSTSLLNVNVVGSTATFTLEPNAHGITVVYIDVVDSQGLSFSTSFNVTVVQMFDDAQLAVDDTYTIDEDAGPVVFTVLDNDAVGDHSPLSIVGAGSGGFSDTVSTIIDVGGQPITAANGDVVIVGNTIQYTPKENYYQLNSTVGAPNGPDTFTYTIQDTSGATSTATVVVNVDPVNDNPTGINQFTHAMEEGHSFSVTAILGLLDDSYDVDHALVDETTGQPVGGYLQASLQGVPLLGSVNVAPDGSYVYQHIGTVAGASDEDIFTFVIEDGSSPVGQSALYEVRITIYPPASPTPPPTPGQVSTIFDMASTPLEQTVSVPPNVLVTMDDSGSMDWHFTVQGDVFDLNNAGVANSDVKYRSYTYLWDLDDNNYSPSSGNGRILPTEEVVEARWSGQQHGVWRGRASAYNVLYYNPEIQYSPWIGYDNANQLFANAIPNAIRLDPIDPTQTFNLLAPHSWDAYSVPDWDSDGGSRRLDVDNIYLPYYYTSSDRPPLVWNSQKSKVTINAAGAPFIGGIGRHDCAVGDNNPLSCTYAQEIRNFANWFQYSRKREYVAKNALGRVIAEVKDIRLGYDTLHQRAQEDIQDMNDLYNTGNKRDVMDAMYSVSSASGTPLREALKRAGDLFSCGSGATCPLLPAPDGTCQQNFSLLFSDGFWNSAAGVSGNQDGDDDTSFDGGRYADSRSNTLADTAMYYYENDISTLDNRVPATSRDLAYAPASVFTGTAPVMHQHMKTYSIAFGVTGTVNPATVLALPPSSPFSWPDPNASSLAKIDDMLHAAMNGRGLYLSARNPDQLKTSMEAAFLEFTAASSSTSAAAFNSTSLQAGTLLFRGFYDLRDSSGELTATQVNADGSLAVLPNWSAADQLEPAHILPTNRKLVSFDPSTDDGVIFRHAALTASGRTLNLNAAQVDWVRGSRAQELSGGSFRPRPATSGLLGDIVNASPIFVGGPPSFNRDQSPYPINDLYSDFVATYHNREAMVYVGANDGILHGFNAVSGLERFGYVPNMILAGTSEYANDLADASSPFYIHKYFVDLTPRLNDIYSFKSPTASGKTWMTTLVGGLGAGGKGFFALDVTNPNLQFVNETTAANSVLWEFTEEDDTYPRVPSNTSNQTAPLNGAEGSVTDPNGAPVKDLGYAISLPNIVMSNVADTGTPVQKQWIAMFGNGQNSTAGYAKLFVLFMDAGLDGWGSGDFVKVDTGYGPVVGADPLAGFPNGLGTVTPVDLNLDGTVDYVYAGDRLGNLFRFDLTDSDPDNWTSTRLFTATYSSGQRQPILSRPLVTRHPYHGGYLVTFGTGSYFAKDDGSDQDIQSVYTIWDAVPSDPSPPTADATTRIDRLVEQTMTNLSDDSSGTTVTFRTLTSNSITYSQDVGPTPGTYGWYIDFDMVRDTATTSGAVNPDTSGAAPPAVQFAGEKAIRRLVYRNGVIFTTTVLPSTGRASCFGSRPGALLIINAITGGDPGRPVIDFNGDGVIDDNDLATDGTNSFAAGLLFDQGSLDGALVDLSTLGSSGANDYLFVSGGNTTEAYEVEQTDDDKIGRLSWRELE